jgi:hypothetical protein
VVLLSEDWRNLGFSYICAVLVRAILIRRRCSLSLGRGKGEGGQQCQEEEQRDVLHGCESYRGEAVQRGAMKLARYRYVLGEDLVPGGDLDCIHDMEIVL